jgi:hypothetical protein
MTTTSFLIDRIVIAATGSEQPVNLVVRVSGDRLYLDVVAAEPGPVDAARASDEATLAAYAVDAAPARVVAVATRPWRRARTRTPTRPASTSRLLGVHGRWSPEPDTDVVVGPASWRRRLLVGSVAATIVLCGVAASVTSQSDAMLVTPTATSTVSHTDPLDTIPPMSSPSLHAAGIDTVERADDPNTFRAIHERCGGARDGAGC